MAVSATGDGTEGRALGGALGFLLPCALLGAAAGWLLYRIEDMMPGTAGGADDHGYMTAIAFVVTSATALLFLGRRTRWAVSAGAALAIGAAVAAASWPAFANFEQYVPRTMDPFPAAFWVMAGAPLTGFLLLTLAKAVIDGGFPPAYREVFMAGLTNPLIGAAAAAFGGFTLLFIYGCARAVDVVGVSVVLDLIEEPYVLLPLAGGIGGLSIALVRGQQSVVGALRFILLALSRMVAPIVAIFSVTFVIAVIVNGTAPIFDRPYPAALLLSIALAVMLIFNGVYQNGAARPPSLWLRISTLAALVTFPVYTGLGLYALWLRVGEYGLTPARFIGLIIGALIAAYSVILILAALSEIRWKAARWLAPVGPLNTAMAVLWVVVLFALQTPPLDPLAWSAKDQYHRLASGKVPVEEFDFGAMRFQLGAPGDEALKRMTSLDTDPDTLMKIRAEVARVRAAQSYYEYRNPDAKKTDPAAGPGLESPKPDSDAPDASSNEPGAEDATPPPAFPSVDDDPSWRDKDAPQQQDDDSEPEPQAPPDF